jgi:hypothetical protein
MERRLREFDPRNEFQQALPKHTKNPGASPWVLLLFHFKLKIGLKLKIRLRVFQKVRAVCLVADRPETCCFRVLCQGVMSASEG